MTETRYTHEVTIENYEVAEARRELESERLIEGEAPASLGEGTDTKAESSRGAARVTPPSLNPQILAHNSVPFREANLLEVR